MTGPNQITPTQLARLMGTPDAPLMIDVRLAENVTEAPVLIPGSRLYGHNDLPELLPGTRAVVICKRGKKLSEGAAAMLRTRGVLAEVLEGGTLAWIEAGLPVLPLRLMAQTDLWVTRHRPKVDRIACPWLIRRFINPDARFLFVAPVDVPEVAENFAATPFDIEGVLWSHRGETCTFDTLIAEFGLSTPALDRLALVVRAADTDRHDLSAQAAGLLALSVGLSRMYRNDLAQLDAGMALYDALYLWARDGFAEGHDWPAGRLA